MQLSLNPEERFVILSAAKGLLRISTKMGKHNYPQNKVVILSEAKGLLRISTKGVPHL